MCLFVLTKTLNFGTMGNFCRILAGSGCLRVGSIDLVLENGFLKRFSYLREVTVGKF